MKTLFTLIFLCCLSVHAETALQSLEGPDLLKDTPVSLQAQADKPLVVIFLSAKCPCSDSHVSELKSLAKDYPGFAFVGVHSNADEDSALSKAYFSKAQLPFPVLKDDQAAIADRYKALKTPHVFVVKADGQLLYQGGVSDSHRFEKSSRNYLREALRDIQAGQKVKASEERALGCSIARPTKKTW
ncbi:MAG: redoxin domain-containing protein [Pseudobdellovibrionaceae bacterium]